VKDNDRNVAQSTSGSLVNTTGIAYCLLGCDTLCNILVDCQCLKRTHCLHLHGGYNDIFTTVRTANLKSVNFSSMFCYKGIACFLHVTTQRNTVIARDMSALAPATMSSAEVIHKSHTGVKLMKYVISGHHHTMDVISRDNGVQPPGGGEQGVGESIFGKSLHRPVCTARLVRMLQW
jgi:hypothetical protein